MKITKISAVILALLLLFAGCGSGGNSAADIADEIKSISPANVSWVDMDRSHIPTFFGLSSEEIGDFKGYINSSEERFDLIAVFAYTSAEEKALILEGAESLSAQMSENYSLVNSEEAEKIRNMPIYETKSFIIICITDNNDEIKAYLQNSLKATEI